MLTMQAVARAMISITFIGRSPESHQKHERELRPEFPKYVFRAIHILLTGGQCDS